MPTLKQLTCNIEWANAPVPFKEFGTTYGDGVVESYIAIPDSPTPFAIRLQSHGYIAPGLAMFVFVDGVYQCNRNRDNLNHSLDPGANVTEMSEVVFRVRQKEEQLPDGTWIGKPWRFEPLRIVPENTRETRDSARPDLSHLGTIHVFILRCHGSNLDGTVTPDSGMEALLDLEEVNKEMSQMRLSALSPVQFNQPVFASFDGPCDGMHQYYVTKHGVLRRCSREPSPERAFDKREILKCRRHRCRQYRHESSADDDASSEQYNGSCTCVHDEDDDTDATSYSSMKLHTQKRSVSASNRIQRANCRHETKTTRARRHTHQSQQPRCGAHDNYVKRTHSCQGRREKRGDSGSLYGRRQHFSPIPDDASYTYTSSDDVMSRCTRSKRQTSTPSTDNRPAEGYPSGQPTYRGTSEYVDQGGNRIVVPPIVLHVNQAPVPIVQPKPILQEKAKKARSISSGCYIVKNGQRILKKKGWNAASSSEDLTEDDNDSSRSTCASPIGVSSNGWAQEVTSHHPLQACGTKNDRAWLSWIKGTGIQHDGNSGSIRSFNGHSSSTPANGSGAHASWTNAAATAAHNGQNIRAGAAETNVQQSTNTGAWAQSNDGGWHQDANSAGVTTDQAAGKWCEESGSWGNTNGDKDGWSHQQAASWDSQNDHANGDAWDQPAVKNTTWDAPGTHGASAQTATWETSDTNNSSQPAGVACQPNQTTGWDTNVTDQTINAIQTDAWDVNCPGKWTEGASNPAKSSNKVPPNPANSTQIATHTSPKQPQNPMQEDRGKKSEYTQIGSLPTPSSCRTPDTILLNETPLYQVPASVAASKALTHQVQPGQESSYVHRIKKPKYIDNLQQPYAKFVFHYRKSDVVEKRFNVKLTPNAAEERMKLEKLPKAEILNRLLMAQGLLDEDTLLRSKSLTTQPSPNRHSASITLPKNANEGIPSSAISMVNFGPIEAKEQGGSLPGNEPVSWSPQQSAGTQGFLQNVNTKLQAHVEDVHDSQHNNGGWYIQDESAVRAW